jgi:hypothetical protein
MGHVTVVTGVIGVGILLIIGELLRRRRLREKYAALWLVVGIGSLPFAFFPTLVDRVAHALGIISGVSLVLFLAVVFLLLICVHLSWEVSQLEEETRILAEEIALIRGERENRDLQQP